MHMLGHLLSDKCIKVVTMYCAVGPFSVLPYAASKGSKRWLLKMHGTITHPEEIVLSKRDYMRYHDRFAAMAGIVQSTLLTRHLLFVGFSLDDDNFQRIFDSVRKARRPPLESDLTLGDNQQYTHFRQRRMRDKANKLLSSKAHYPIYDTSEPEPVLDSSNICGTAMLLEYSHLKVMYR